AAPFITAPAVDIVRSGLTEEFRHRGSIEVLTSLDVISVCQGTCDPLALRTLLGGARAATLTHLPRLHAKVYVADSCAAIISSANLTGGGLFANFEYGVELSEPTVVAQVRGDLHEYAALGATVGDEQLTSFCEVSRLARDAFQNQLSSVAGAFRNEFERRSREAEDQLVRFRLSGGACHTVFAKTILFLLKRHGPLSTVELHPLVQSIHPDLCDDSVDRVIDGKRFGKKWKHAVRTAQQKLTRDGLVALQKGRWSLVYDN
ncbi:MAG TPA: phospholipase D-like domain-containing protein, partial [Isosphaeraceae bacterium]|nr:phospholipase D-like domain-containing protein [Isosphaeraceae bacterium]